MNDAMPPARPALFPGALLVIDTETTGLPGHQWTQPVELAAVLLDATGAEVSAFEILIRPPILDSRADDALRISGLTRARLWSEGIAPVYARQALLSWLRGQQQQPERVYAFNMAFDCQMLRRIGIDLQEIAPLDCVQSEATRAGSRGRLAVIAERLGVPVQQPAHRALADARTAAGVLVRLRAMMPPEPEPEPEAASVGQMSLFSFSGGAK